jgi:hypothetical protein
MSRLWKIDAALVTALVVLLILALRWRASHEEADLLRTYPPKDS